MNRPLLRLSLLGALAWAVSCASARPAPERPLDPPGASGPRRAEVAIEPAEAVADVEVIETPTADSLRTDVPELARVACSIDSQAGSWLSAVLLRVELAGPRFAQISAVPTVVQLSGKGPIDGARFAIEADGFALRGLVPGSELVLTPSRAALWGVVVPKSGARVKWIGSVADRPEVSLKLEGGVAPPGDRPLVWRPSCAELSLASVKFDPRAAIPDDKPRRTAWVGTLDPFTISSEVSSGDSLVVQAVSGDHEVEVFATRARRVQIAIDQENHLLFGWTDAGNLRSYRLGAGRSVGHGSGRGKLGARPSRIAKLRCQRDVEIVAAWDEPSSARSIVGAIRAGTEFWIVPPRGEETGAELVKLPGWLSIVSDARLEVASELAATCKTSEP